MIYEAKSGYTTASRRIRKQIEKDYFLMGSERLNVEWHFYKSPITGRVGPSKVLAELLRSKNIGVKIHEE